MAQRNQNAPNFDESMVDPALLNLQALPQQPFQPSTPSSHGSRDDGFNHTPLLHVDGHGYFPITPNSCPKSTNASSGRDSLDSSDHDYNAQSGRPLTPESLEDNSNITGGIEDELVASEPENICAKCGGDFGDEKGLRKHYNLFKDHKPLLECVPCNLTFKWRKDQIRHFETTKHDPNGTKSRCDVLDIDSAEVCGQGFTRKDNLRRHLVNKHGMAKEAAKAHVKARDQLSVRMYKPSV